MPKTFEGINNIQKKRFKNYQDLMGTVGEGSKIAGKLLTSETKDDLELMQCQRD
jgi:hypothetical protein